MLVGMLDLYNHEVTRAFCFLCCFLDHICLPDPLGCTIQVGVTLPHPSNTGLQAHHADLHQDEQAALKQSQLSGSEVTRCFAVWAASLSSCLSACRMIMAFRR